VVKERNADEQISRPKRGVEEGVDVGMHSLGVWGSDKHAHQVVRVNFH
jgi:hypothetical protein